MGSGNPGTTNVLRTLGWLPSALTLLGDVLKGLLGGWIGYWIAGEMGARIGGAFAVAGHNWPVFAKFKGGKGIAASLGAILAIEPWFGLGCVVVEAVVVILTRYVSAGLHLRRDFLFCHHLHMPLGGVVEHSLSPGFSQPWRLSATVPTSSAFWPGTKTGWISIRSTSYPKTAKRRNRRERQWRISI